MNIERTSASTVPSENENEGLKRVVGIPTLAATVVNSSVGAGIYTLPAIIAMYLGAAGIIGFLFCGLMFAAIVLCYVEMGSRVKVSGGSYAYVEAAFGPFAGFVVNWLVFFGWSVLSDAAIMNVIVDSVIAIFPVLSTPFIRVLLLGAVMALIIFINIRSSKLSVYFLAFITIIKLVPLLAIVAFGIFKMQLSNLEIHHFPSLNSFNLASLTLFFSLAGFETTLNVGGEIKNPARTVPRGILLGGLITFFIYVAIQQVTVGVLGSEVNQVKEAPLAAVAERVIGSIGATALLVAGAITCFGTVMGDVFSGPRLLFAGARDGLFPHFLGKVHPRFATPHWAIVIYGSLIFCFSAIGGFNQLAVLASGALLLIYLAVVASLIKFRMQSKVELDKGFKIPGGLLIPFIAIAAIMYVLSSLKGREIVWIVVFVAAICLIYILMRYYNKSAVPRDNQRIP